MCVSHRKGFLMMDSDNSLSVSPVTVFSSSVFPPSFIGNSVLYFFYSLRERNGKCVLNPYEVKRPEIKIAAKLVTGWMINFLSQIQVPCCYWIRWGWWSRKERRDPFLVGLQCSWMRGGKDDTQVQVSTFVHSLLVCLPQMSTHEFLFILSRSSFHSVGLSTHHVCKTVLSSVISLVLLILRDQT